MQDSIDQHRRMLLQAAGMLAIAPAADAVSMPPASTGNPGDFDFLLGNWTIKNRQRKDGKWEEFDGEASVVGILGGVASVEELRIPARNFSGMGLRILDVERKLWADYWCNRKNGILDPAAWGSFVNGVGTGDAADTEDGRPVVVRGVWDQIAPDRCRWYQAVSRDGGATWEENWVMQWRRV